MAFLDPTQYDAPGVFSGTERLTHAEIIELSDKFRELRGDLPPRLRGSIEFQAVLYCVACEADRMDACLDFVTDQFFPQRATSLLKAWEAIARTTVEPTGRSEADRRDGVLARLRLATSEPSGLGWVADLTAIIGSNAWDYEEHVPGDVTSPAEFHLRVLLPFDIGTPEFDGIVVWLREMTEANLVLDVLPSSGMRLGHPFGGGLF